MKLAPHITEKTVKLVTSGVYTFRIDGMATATEAKGEISKRYGVTVIAANIGRRPAKIIRSGRRTRTRRGIETIVFATLKSGESIEAFKSVVSSEAAANTEIEVTQPTKKSVADTVTKT